MNVKSYTNMYATTYESGDCEIIFDCIGVMQCKYAICEFMPPTEADMCMSYEHGACRCYASQMEAMRDLIGIVRKKIKELKGMGDYE